MSLAADIGVTLDDFTLDVTIEAAAGETVAVLGPNGAGKSSLLRCLAGLTALDRGRVVLDGRTLDEPTTGIRVAPQERAVGMVFQQHLLFPSMSVLENVAFGLRSRGRSRTDARHRASDLLASVGLADRAASRPQDLSGGQSQRVALARALAIEPRMVLLDEPLAALDVTTRNEVRRELATHLGRLDCVRLLVTHDPVDAFALADRVIVLEAGRVTQSGPIATVTSEPRTQYLADLMGVSLFAGVGGDREFVHPDGTRWAVDSPAPGAGFAAVHPRDVLIVDAGTDTAGPNVITGTVTAVDLERDRALVRIVGAIAIAAELDPAAAVQRGLRPGDPVTVRVPPAAVRTYPRT